MNLSNSQAARLTIADFGFHNFGFHFRFKKINTKYCQLSIPGFLIFEFYAPIKTGVIIALMKVNLRRLLMQMLERVKHCPALSGFNAS